MSKSEDAIRNFLADISCLDELESMLGKSNIFDVLGMARTEIRHSNVLRWLLDPKGSHGFGELYLRMFLQRLAGEGADAIALLATDLTSFTVLREYKHIDILLLSREARVVIAIENKVDAGEHNHQLRRYEETLEEDFPGYYRELVFLSPEGLIPSEASWRPLTYEVILSSLQYCLERVSISSESALLLSQYAHLLEREFMNKEKLSEICNRIYREHKQALDLIFEMREDRCRVVYNMISNWFKRHPQSRLVFDEAHSTKTYLRMTTAWLMALVPSLEEGKKSGWGTNRSVYYEIVNRPTGLVVKLSASAKNIEASSFEALREAFRKKPGDFSTQWQWKTIKLFSTRRKLNENDEESLNQDQVDDFMSCLEKEIEDLETKLQ